MYTKKGYKKKERLLRKSISLYIIINTNILFEKYYIFTF